LLSELSLLLGVYDHPAGGSRCAPPNGGRGVRLSSDPPSDDACYLFSLDECPRERREVCRGEDDDVRSSGNRPARPHAPAWGHTPFPNEN
jgi:hypothetical protein